MSHINALRKTASTRSPSASVRSPPARPQPLKHGTIADAAKRIEASNRRITSLAIALTEGGDAIEIAGQLLDEVDSAGGTGEEDAAGDDLDSVLRVTLSRIAALEYQMDDFMTIVRSSPGGWDGGSGQIVGNPPRQDLGTTLVSNRDLGCVAE
jgi:hypothetical protein